MLLIVGPFGRWSFVGGIKLLKKKVLQTPYSAVVNVISPSETRLDFVLVGLK